MEHASLLFYLAKPQSGSVWDCDLRHCTSEPFDFRRFVEVAERRERTHSSLRMRGHVAVVVPMFRALIVIRSVDRLGSVALKLTRSLPRDVYIRRQNYHPGGQGRIYTSHLNFVSTHLSKPRHRRGCCCMSPRCLLRQFVDRCLLFWAIFIEKTVLPCFARLLSKWRETALWLFPDATSWYELYV